MIPAQNLITEIFKSLEFTFSSLFTSTAILFNKRDINHIGAVGFKKQKTSIWIAVAIFQAVMISISIFIIVLIKKKKSEKDDATTQEMVSDEVSEMSPLNYAIQSADPFGGDDEFVSVDNPLREDALLSDPFEENINEHI